MEGGGLDKKIVLGGDWSWGKHLIKGKEKPEWLWSQVSYRGILILEKGLDGKIRGGLVSAFFIYVYTYTYIGKNLCIHQPRNSGPLFT